jgi:hypothetical protein
MRGIELPYCASDRGVSKDLTDRLVGHDKTITNVGVLFDNATSVEYSTASQFFPTDQLEYGNTGFAIGINTQNRSSCFAVLGDTYTQNGKSYRTYRGKIIEQKQRQKQKSEWKVLNFNGIKGGGKYLEPTIEKLAADTAYNGTTTHLDEISRMSLKYGGDASQRIMAAGAMKAGVPSTVTTGDGNMLNFSLNGITFEGSKDPTRFPVVYGKMRTLQDPEQSVIVNNGAKSLIISAWPDQGNFTDEQIILNREINTKKMVLEDTATTDNNILQFISELDLLASNISNLLENTGAGRINRDQATQIENQFKDISVKAKAYGFTISLLNTKFGAPPKIQQIYEIFLREMRENTYIMLKTKLEQLLSDSMTRQRLLEKEIVNAKELFESFTKTTNDDNDDDEYEDEDMDIDTDTDDADSQFDFHSQYGDQNSYYMESKPISRLFRRLPSIEETNRRILKERAKSEPRILKRVRRGGTITEKGIYYKRYHKKTNKKTNKKSKNNKTKSTKTSKNRRTKKKSIYKIIQPFL